MAGGLLMVYGIAAMPGSRWSEDTTVVAVVEGSDCLTIVHEKIGSLALGMSLAFGVEVSNAIDLFTVGIYCKKPSCSLSTLVNLCD